MGTATALARKSDDVYVVGSSSGCWLIDGRTGAAECRVAHGPCRGVGAARGLIAAAGGERVRLYDARAPGDVLVELDAGFAPRCLGFDDCVLCCGSDDGTLRIWDALF